MIYIKDRQINPERSEGNVDFTINYLLKETFMEEITFHHDMSIIEVCQYWSYSITNTQISEC